MGIHGGTYGGVGTRGCVTVGEGWFTDCKFRGRGRVRSQRMPDSFLLSVKLLSRSIVFFYSFFLTTLDFFQNGVFFITFYLILLALK